MRKFPGLRGSFRVSLFLSTLVTAVASSQALLVTDAKADASVKVKVAVGGFEGAKSDDVRSAFIEALKKDGSYEVTDAEDVKASAKAKAVADAAAGLGVNVVITGKVSKGFGLKLKVLGADGKQLDDAEIKGGTLPKLKSAIEKSGVSSVADGIGKAKKEEPKKEEEKPAEEPKPEEEEEKPTEEASASASTSDNSKGLSPLDITAGLRPMHRTFTFHDTLADRFPTAGYTQLLKYELPLGPTVFIDLNWFPASHFMQGPAEWIGLTAGFEKGFATQSIYGEGLKDEKVLKTNEQSFYVGGRFRLPIGEHTLGLTGTYGQHQFLLIGDEGACSATQPLACPLIPDVKYGFVRVGVDGMFRFGDFMAGAHIGKRFVTSTGPLKTLWFPAVKGQSLEAGVQVGYRVIRMLDIVAGFDWLRYAFNFNPVPIRTGYIAGGAVDEYLTGHVGLRFHLPGKGEAAPE